MGPDPTDTLEDRLDRARRHGFRIEVGSERVSQDTDTRWRPRAVVWGRTGTGDAQKVLPLESGRGLTFPTRQEADEHALRLAVEWAEERY